MLLGRSASVEADVRGVAVGGLEDDVAGLARHPGALGQGREQDALEHRADHGPAGHAVDVGLDVVLGQLEQAAVVEDELALDRAVDPEPEPPHVAGRPRRRPCRAGDRSRAGPAAGAGGRPCGSRPSPCASGRRPPAAAARRRTRRCAVPAAAVLMNSRRSHVRASSGWRSRSGRLGNGNLLGGGVGAASINDAALARRGQRPVAAPRRMRRSCLRYAGLAGELRAAPAVGSAAPAAAAGTERFR